MANFIPKKIDKILYKDAYDALYKKPLICTNIIYNPKNEYDSIARLSFRHSIISCSDKTSSEKSYFYIFKKYGKQYHHRPNRKMYIGADENIIFDIV